MSQDGVEGQSGMPMDWRQKFGKRPSPYYGLNPYLTPLTPEERHEAGLDDIPESTKLYRWPETAELEAEGIANLALSYTSDEETPFWREAIMKAVQPLVAEVRRLREELEDRDWRAQRYTDLMLRDDGITWQLERDNIDLRQRLATATEALRSADMKLQEAATGQSFRVWDRLSVVIKELQSALSSIEGWA